jgi:hypothetical protein
VNFALLNQESLLIINPSPVMMVQKLRWHGCVTRINSLMPMGEQCGLGMELFLEKLL